MSVDTNAILFGAPSQEEVAAALRSAFDTDVAVEQSSVDHMYRLRFLEPQEESAGVTKNRMMFVFPDNDSADYEDVYTGRHTYCTISMRGRSVEIMEALAARFGGFVRDNDCKDGWRRVDASPETAPELSDEDVLRIELADIAGPKSGTALAALVSEPEKLEKIMAAYSEYKARKEALTPSP